MLVNHDGILNANACEELRDKGQPQARVDHDKRLDHHVADAGARGRERFRDDAIDDLLEGQDAVGVALVGAVDDDRAATALHHGLHSLLHGGDGLQDREIAIHHIPRAQ